MGQFPDKVGHCLHVVVNPSKQNGLVSHRDTSLEESPACHLCDPGNLIGMIEVRMQSNTLAPFLRLVGHRDQCVRPTVTAVEETIWGHGESFGSKTNAPNVVHAKQPLANHPELFGL